MPARGRRGGSTGAWPVNAKAGRAAQRLAACLTLLLPAPALLADCGPTGAAQADASALSLRLDNDLFSGTGRDDGYTSGVLATWVSRWPDSGGCVPSPLAWLGRNLSWLQPAGDETSLRASLGMALFTPSDREARVPVADDRPYAALLLAGFGFDARRGDRLRSTQLRLGMVGPSLRGDQIHNGFHRLIGAEPFRGWGHQLRDEPVVQLLHERLRRRLLFGSPGAVASDLITHWGGSVGNLHTYANAGAQWRIGRHLPQDFGSDPVRPAGGVLPLPAAGADSLHLFVSVDVRAVARNLTLDGNTWRDSHRVDRRSLLGEAGVGVVVERGRWKLVLARHGRTREFHRQKSRTDYGTLALSATL